MGELDWLRARPQLRYHPCLHENVDWKILDRDLLGFAFAAYVYLWPWNFPSLINHILLGQGVANRSFQPIQVKHSGHMHSWKWLISRVHNVHPGSLPIVHCLSLTCMYFPLLITCHPLLRPCHGGTWLTPGMTCKHKSAQHLCNKEKDKAKNFTHYWLCML